MVAILVECEPADDPFDAIRGLLVNGPVATPTMQALLWAVGFTVVFAPFAVRAFMRRT